MSKIFVIYLDLPIYLVPNLANDIVRLGSYGGSQYVAVVSYRWCPTE